MVPCTGKLAVHLRVVRMQRLLRCADSKTRARSHSIVPWGLIVRACLSSQSKSNSCVPKEACLGDWRGFPPCLVNTGGLKEINNPISFCPYGRGIVLFGVLKWSLAQTCTSAWEIMSQKMPSQLDFSFAVLAGRLKDIETNLHVTCRSCPFTWGMKLAEEAMLECFCPCGICPGDTWPLLSLGLSLTSENSLDSWQNCRIYQQRNSLFSK